MLYHVGHLSRDDSLFTYLNGNSYDTFNSESQTFVPAFGLGILTPELNTTATEICGDVYSCLYDIAVTGSSTLGRLTHEISQDNQKIKEDLGKPTMSTLVPNLLYTMYIYIHAYLLCIVCVPVHTLFIISLFPLTVDHHCCILMSLFIVCAQWFRANRLCTKQCDVMNH